MANRCYLSTLTYSILLKDSNREWATFQHAVKYNSPALTCCPMPSLRLVPVPVPVAQRASSAAVYVASIYQSYQSHSFCRYGYSGELKQFQWQKQSKNIVLRRKSAVIPSIMPLQTVSFKTSLSQMPQDKYHASWTRLRVRSRWGKAGPLICRRRNRRKNAQARIRAFRSSSWDV